MFPIGIKVVISEHVPTMEAVTLEYKRSVFERLFAGRMNDIQVTEEDGIWWIKQSRGEIGGVPYHQPEMLVMNRHTFDKVKKFLDDYERDKLLGKL